MEQSALKRILSNKRGKYEKEMGRGGGMKLGKKDRNKFWDFVHF